MPKIIMGLDPGSQHTGIGIVQVQPHDHELLILDCDVIDLKKQKHLCDKLALLSDRLESKFQTFQPHEIAIENVFLGKNVAAAFTLGQARGVCMAVAGRYGHQTTEYAPRKIKKLLTGNGAADKTQIQEHLRVFYGIEHGSADACDALAIAICHAQNFQIKMRLQSQEGQL